MENAQDTSLYADVNSDLIAPRWVYSLAEIDAVDTVLAAVGFPAAYALGGVPGIVAWGGIYVGITVIRKTPLILWAVNLIVEWRKRPEIIKGKFRDEVFPSFRKDAGELVYHPSVQRVIVSEITRQKIYTSTESPVRQAPATPGKAGGASAPGTAADVPRPPQSGVSQHRHPAGTSMRLWVQQYQGLPKLEALHGRHIVIFGPTGMGKSAIIKWLLRQRQQGTLMICDPHYQPGNWPGRACVVGKGRNFAEIAETIQLIILEMGRRYEQSGNGQIHLDEVEPIYLVIDEMSALAEQEPEAVKQLLTIAQEGRKARIFTLLTPHGQNVETMGLKGRGDARANFAFIEGQPVPEELKHFPRIVTVTLGPPKEKDSQVLGRFVVPAPQVYIATPHFGVPNWLNQGEPGVCLPGVFERQQGVLEGVLGNSKHGVLDDKHTQSTGFEQRYKPDSDQSIKLTQYLATKGYGLRKIGGFLPFDNNRAREIAREILSEINQMPKRPVSGSKTEKEMVRYLHGDCGAPLERIAKLLDGNTWENLSRIQNTANYVGE